MSCAKRNAIWFSALLAILTALYACEADGSSNPASPGDGDGDGDRDGQVDEEFKPDAWNPPDPPDEPPANTVIDRCNSSQCEPSLLVPQEDLVFLEDMGDGWKRLMEADWHMAGSSEGYRCMGFTVPEDVMITAFFPQGPPGTHHATFGVSSQASGPDDVYACGVGTAGERRLQGSGAGTEPTELPPGVGMRLRRGEQILMNLHLFNVNEEPLRGRSGMWVKTIAESEVEHEAESVLAGPLQLFVPVGRSTQTGTCTMVHDVTIFSVGPHMHQTGVHMRATATSRGDTIELHDRDYDFMEQTVYPIEAVELEQGDVVSLECTYENGTDAPIMWGDSSLAEMCFISLGLYPAGGFPGLPCMN
jgi:hypothetical protein